MKDLSIRESVILSVMVIAILFTGLFPQPLINTAKPAVNKIINVKERSFRSENMIENNVSGNTFFTHKVKEEVK